MKYLLLLLIPSFLQSQTLQISSGAHARHQTPIFVTLPKPFHQTSYLLINQKTKTSTPAQLINDTTLFFILQDKLPAKTTNTYKLQPTTTNIKPITITENNNNLTISINNKPLLTYHTQLSLPPTDSPAYYQRSGFIHPLRSPSGAILTDDFPAGHAHQHAIFTAWPNTTFRKEFTDFWNQHLQKGTVEHIKVVKQSTGPLMAQLQVLLRYKSFSQGEVLQEKWTVNIYPFTNYYLFDLYSEQTNTTTDTLYLNQYHYGGLAFRGSAAWNPDDKKNFKDHWHILTSENIRDSAANQTHARWVDAYGMVDGKTAGVTVFNHPNNFRYPQAIRVHPAMPYWAYSPVVDGAFTIDPGGHYRSQFRYYVHEGTPDKTVIEKLEKDWIAPPVVKIIY
jgi:hypothetical protein